MKTYKIYDDNNNFFGTVRGDSIETPNETANYYATPDSYDVAYEKLEQYRKEHNEDPPDGYPLLIIDDLFEGDETVSKFPLFLDDGRKGMIVGDFFVVTDNLFTLDRTYIYHGGEIEEHTAIRII